MSQWRFLALEGAVSLLESVCAFWSLDGIGGLGSGCDRVGRGIDKVVSILITRQLMSPSEERAL